MAALVVNSIEMTEIPVNRIDKILVEDVIREEYGLGARVSRSVYCTLGRLGENSNAVVRSLRDVLKKRYDVMMDAVFMGWTSLFFEPPD